MFFFFNDTATTEIYTLSYTTLFRSPSNAHNVARGPRSRIVGKDHSRARMHIPRTGIDRKSTRLNSSHLGISYAVFCLKKKTSSLACTEYAAHSHNPSRQPSEADWH